MSRPSPALLRPLALLVAGSLAFAACGDGDDPAPSPAAAESDTSAPDAGVHPLAATAEELATIEKGRLSMQIEVTVGDAATGFEVSGPFSFDSPGDLAIVDLAQQQRLGDQTVATRLVSTGERAFTEIDGVMYELGDAESASLRLADDDQGAEAADPTGLDELRLDEWVRDPVESQDGDRVTVTGELDVAAFLGDLATVSRQLGGDTSTIEAAEGDAARLNGLAREKEVTVVVEVDGRELERLEVRLVLDQAAATTADLGTDVEIRFVLELTDRDDQPEVTAPPDARPLSELPG